ncbi:MAG: hypothetical protein HOP95_09450 [Sphingomonas sp.]|nr:hypothetical protein [Sphingomonas sp.]
MNKLLIGGAAAALFVAFAPALAQSAPPPGVAQGTAPARPLPPQPGAPRMHMRAMSDHVMTRDEVVKHVQKMFARFDTNHDGFVTKEEVEGFHQRMGMMDGRPGMEGRFAEHRMHRPDRAAMFDKLDTNHDGVISKQEFMAARPELHERRMVVMRDGGAPGAPGEPGMHRMGMHMHGAAMHRGGFGRHLFEMADTNRDGRVSLQEAEAAALAHFDKADPNHDGKLTPEERRQAHQLMRGEHRPS